MLLWQGHGQVGLLHSYRDSLFSVQHTCQVQVATTVLPHLSMLHSQSCLKQPQFGQIKMVSIDR